MAWQDFPCRLWDGADNGVGYGVVRRSNPRRMVLVHREAFEESLGRPLEPGEEVLHHCDWPGCYEVEHLFLGSQADNMADMVAKGRHWNQQKTECKHGHKFTPETSRTDSRGRRLCLVCRVEYNRLYRLSHKKETSGV